MNDKNNILTTQEVRTYSADRDKGKKNSQVNRGEGGQNKIQTLAPFTVCTLSNSASSLSLSSSRISVASQTILGAHSHFGVPQVHRHQSFDTALTFGPLFASTSCEVVGSCYEQMMTHKRGSRPTYPLLKEDRAS